ncbi:hypothetical protein KQI84_07330 [bacterium]|nr:hypothetical protein [bacterium]
MTARLRTFLRHDGPLLLVLVVAPVLYWWPLLAGYLPDFMDVVAQLYPMRLEAARQFHSGTLPLWMPTLLSGTPLAADPQIAVWYPPLWLLFLVPGVLTNGLVILFHYVWAGWGMYAWTRRLGHWRSAALFAALAFQFGSMMVSRIALQPHLFAVAWVPWIFLSAEFAAHAAAHQRRGAWRSGGVLAASVFIALQLLAGAPQISYYTAILLPIYWLGRAFQQAPKRRRGRVLALAAAQGLAAGALAAALAAIQLLPTLDFLDQASRGEIGLDQLRTQGLGGSFLWTSLIGFSGTPLEDTDSINAIGFGALALIPLALFRRKTAKPAILLLVIGVLSYVLALGVLAPVWAKILPLYDGFHAPRRALIIWSVVGPAAAGLGAANLIVFFRRRRLPRIAAIAALMILLGGGVWILPRLERVFTTPERFDPDPEIASIIRDSGRRFLTLDPTMAYSYDSRRPDFGLSLLPDLAAWQDVQDAQGYNPLLLERYAVATRFGSGRVIQLYPSHGAFMTNPNSNLLRVLAVQHLVGRWDYFRPEYRFPGTGGIGIEQLAQNVEVIVDNPRWPLSRFKEDRPMAWIVPRAVAVETPEQALRGAMANDPYEIAFVESEIAPWLRGAIPAVTSAEWVDARTFDVTLESPLPDIATVVVSIPWCRGWQAENENGDLLELVPADGVIIGILADPGTTMIRLRYEPKSFQQGVMITFGALLLLGAGLAKRRRECYSR